MTPRLHSATVDELEQPVLEVMQKQLVPLTVQQSPVAVRVPVVEVPALHVQSPFAPSGWQENV
jgi:hypothetical protein